MMKRIIYIPVLIISLFTACSEQILDPDANGGGNGDGEILINILPPTVATTDDQFTRSGDWPVISNPEAMPAGSTIRLFIYDATAKDTDNNPHSNNRLKKKEMAFRVRSKAEIEKSKDKRALVPCKVNAITGAAEGDITDTDLHLPSSDYDFFAISPAVELDPLQVGSYDIPAYIFQHGGVVAKDRKGDLPTTIYTSEPLRRVEVRQADGITAGVHNLQLNTFRLLSSRVRFIMVRGKDVDSMRIENRGIVMSNMTYDAFSPNFVIGEPKLRETLLQDSAAVFGSVPILNARELKDQPTGNTGETYDYHTWELITEVIPNPDNDNEHANPPVILKERDVILTFHLLINGDNYKSYEYILRNQRFLRGSEYTYEVTVNAGGLFVRGWRNNQWTVTIPK